MNQISRSRLDLLDADLANRIRHVTSDVLLRLFACECASIAFAWCGNGDMRSLRAIEVGRCYALGLTNDKSLDEALAFALEAADAADEAAFDARDALDKGETTKNAYSKAFGAARAAFSAKDCCRRSSAEAALNAAYESLAALRTAVENGQTLGGIIPATSYDTETEIDQAIVGVLKAILDAICSIGS